jgi:DNA adenine methylase
MKSFLKWAGGKHKLISRIEPHLRGAVRIVEPFVGGASVSLNVSAKYYWLNDVNQDLINLYQTVCSNQFDSFLEMVEWLLLDNNNNEESYYEYRAEFNNSPYSLRRAALFVYLNRHGYNGLCRYNSQGAFNVPFGRYKTIYFPKEEMVYFYERFKDTSLITCQDFRDVLINTGKGDIVYCDPPYVPLSDTADFTSYSAGGFSEQDQIDLANLSYEASLRGVKVVLSNHYTKFTAELYQKAQLETFEVQRNISCDADNRGKALEMLAVFEPREG